MLLPYRVKVSDTTLQTMLALCTYLYRSHLGEPVSMKQTRHRRKSEAQNLCSKCPPFTRTHAFKRLHHCAIAATMTVWSSSFHSLISRLLSTPSHHGSANGRPSLEGYPRCCSPPDWRIGWPHLWRDKLLASLSLSLSLFLQHGDSVTCAVNGMISVTSTLRHRVRDLRDVHGMQRSKFTSMISIHLQSCVPKIIKIRAYL